MNQEELGDLQHALVQSWHIDTSTGLDTHEFLDALAKRVAHMLKSDFDRLASAMYTLDVNDTRFNEAIGLTGNENSAHAVAELILERETQKMYSRMEYLRMREKADSETLEEKDAYDDVFDIDPS